MFTMNEMQTLLGGTEFNWTSMHASKPVKLGKHNG